MLKRYFCILIIFFVCLQVNICSARPQFELESEYLTHVSMKDRYIDTVSLHLLEKVSQKGIKSLYRGITITRPHGNLINENHETKDSTAFGIGPIYMVRYEKKIGGKLSEALNLSGGAILYDRPFPAEGKHYNFMWRVQPKLIYKLNDNSSINLGWTFMHVSNGLRTHNPGYDARVISLGIIFNY